MTKLRVLSFAAKPLLGIGRTAEEILCLRRKTAQSLILMMIIISCFFLRVQLSVPLVISANLLISSDHLTLQLQLLGN